MAGRVKHMERSHRSHGSHRDAANYFATASAARAQLKTAKAVQTSWQQFLQNIKALIGREK